MSWKRHMGSNHIISRFLPIVILASQSTARKDLLISLGCTVISMPTNSDEYHEGSVGKDVVQDLAQKKMESFLSQHPSPTLPVITADTLVSYGSQLLGKPKDSKDAHYYIQLLQGETHSVCSGYSVYLPAFRGKHDVIINGSDEAFVTFHTLTSKDIELYVSGNDWYGAAGAYRIQGLAKSFISNISGDYTTVVGLPIDAISAILS